MDTPKKLDSSATTRLLRRAADGDQEGWALLVARHEGRLKRMFALRLDRRLQGRVDPSDVLQDTYLEAWTHLAEYAEQPKMSFYLWLRSIANHTLCALHRRHLGARMRTAGREVSLYHGMFAEATSAALAAQLLGRDPRPSEAAAKAELKIRLEAALNQLEAIDREVLALRHFEQLSNVEAAEVLGIPPSSASSRYLRALKRVKKVFVLQSGHPE
jgi:RNA polymerase sigma-70 factor (ECF subfamily)